MQQQQQQRLVSWAATTARRWLAALFFIFRFRLLVDGSRTKCTVCFLSTAERWLYMNRTHVFKPTPGALFYFRRVRRLVAEPKGRFAGYS